MREIWTGAVRRVLYSRLVELFGPYDQWQASSSPAKGRDPEFDQFCSDFAKAVGAKSADAVKHQIRFALPETGRGSVWKEGHARSAILNKAGALEAGFIKDENLPDLLAVGRKRSVEELEEMLR